MDLRWYGFKLAELSDAPASQAFGLGQRTITLRTAPRIPRSLLFTHDNLHSAHLLRASYQLVPIIPSSTDSLKGLKDTSQLCLSVMCLMHLLWQAAYLRGGVCLQYSLKACARTSGCHFLRLPLGSRLLPAPPLAEGRYRKAI